MTFILKHGPLVAVFVALSACSILGPEQTARLCADDNGNFHQCTDILIEKQESKQHPSLFASDLHFVQLGEYTQQMALELKNDLPMLGLHGSVIVTPFVSRSGLTEESNNLGQDLADFLTNDLRNLGVTTSDQGLFGYLNRTERGNIEFSAEQQEILTDLDASYVLIGNLRRINSGLMLNAKITELKSGKIMATSAKLLPNVVINNIF